MARMFNLKSSSTAYTKEEYIIIYHKKNNNHHIYNKTNKKISTRPKCTKRRIGTIGVLCIVLLILCASGYQAGFIPLKSLLVVREPMGVTGEINMDECIEMTPAIANIPSINRLKHKLFTSDKSINIVALDYKQRLEKRGYRLEYVGKENIRGITVSYFGFVRGITAIGIIMTEDENSLLGSGTLVLYTTGSVFAYNRILKWYGSASI